MNNPTQSRMIIKSSGLKCSLLLLLFSIVTWSISASAIEPVNIQVYYDRTMGPVEPVWRFIGYDEANYTYSPDGLALLDEIAQLSPQPVYIRCHHLLTSGDGSTSLKWCSTNVYTEDQNGNPVYDWTIIDKLFDTWHERGLKPLVELGFMPEALSSRPENYTPKKVFSGEPKGMVEGGAFYPPKDYQKWQALIEALAQHCVERYGREETESWLWELWNEPNIGYWRGTPQEYIKLYDYTATAIKKVLPGARMGGPHVTNPDGGGSDRLLRAFIEHCLHGKNEATGDIGTPVDFIAFHTKGGTQYRDGKVIMNHGNHLRTMDHGFEIIASYPELEGIPVIIGESDPDGCAACSARLYPGNGYRNGTQYAVYTAATFLRKQELAQRRGVRIMGGVTWAFTFPDQPWFDGFRSLSTNQVPKPVFNAFRMFSLLETERIAAVSTAAHSLNDLMKSSVRSEPDIDAFATRSDQAVSILIWHYHDSSETGPAADIVLDINRLPIQIKQARLTHYRIDDQFSNAYTTWLKMGSPQPPSHEQIELLLKSSELQQLPGPDKVKVNNGSTELNFNLPRLGLSLIRLQW